MNMWGYAIAVAAVICYGLLGPIAKKLQLNIPPFATIAITMFMLCAYATIASLFFEKDFSIAKISPRGWLGLVAFSAINFAAFAFYLIVIAKMPVTHYQLITLIGPIAGGILAYFLLGEMFKPQYLYGLMFIALGLFVALRGGVN
jgi:drug/metabolite transporter (DMT)-like permease